MEIRTFLRKIFSRYTGFHFINLFFFVLCCVFSIYDISSHIKSYYEFQVIVNTKLVFDPKIYLPSVTICIPTVANLEQLKITFPDVHKKVTDFRHAHKQGLDAYEWRNLLAEYLTIGQLRQVAPNFKHVIMSCMFRTNQDKFVDCDRYVPIQQHFSMNHVCYIFFEQNVKEVNNKVDQSNFDSDVEFDYSLVNKTEKPSNVRARNRLIDSKANHEEYFLYENKKIKNKDWIRILINKTSLWNGWIDFGIGADGRFYEMYHGQPNFMCISTDVLSSVEFTFSQKNIMRLPPPYDSMCFDYTSIGYRDRSHYVETCYANKTIEKFKKWPFFLETSDNKFKNIDGYHFLKKDQDEHGLFYYTCSEEQSRANCNYTQMEIRMNEVNFCQLNVTIDNSMWDTYLMENLTESLKMETNEKTPLLNQIVKDDRKNRILMLRHRKLMESNSCDLRSFLIVIQFTDDHITELHYDVMNPFWDLMANIGQSISVYLGLCLYDFHKLFGVFFDWFDGDNETGESARPHNDLLDSKFGRKLSKQLSARLNARKKSINYHNKSIGQNDFDDPDTLKQKIRTFDTMQGQLQKLNRMHNLQLINDDLLAKYNYSKQLNNQLTPMAISGTSNNGIKKANLSELGNLLMKKSTGMNPTINPLLIDNKFYSNSTNKSIFNKQTDNDRTKRKPSLIYVDDYLFNIINMHKKQVDHTV